MFPREFEYVAPSSLDEALRLLAGSPEAKVMAGGHSLLPMMKMRLVSPAVIVDLGSIEGLGRIADFGDHLSIGPLATHAAVASSSLVRSGATALAEAAGMVGDAQVRNRGTVCGSVAHGDSIADEPGAVLALQATIVASSVRGVREITAADFFVDTLTTALERDEIISELRVPTATRSAYDKLGRRGGQSDYPIVGVAAAIGDCGLTLAVTGAASKPTLLDAGLGEPAPATATEIGEIADRALSEIQPVADLYGSEDYKRHLVGVYVRRVLTRLAST